MDKRSTIGAVRGWFCLLVVGFAAVQGSVTHAQVTAQTLIGKAVSDDSQDKEINNAISRFRDRDIRPGAQVVLSPWHLHRHELLWENPDGFDPGRWQTANGRDCARDAYMPFSAGPRVCTGAGFAMAEGVLMLALFLCRFRFAPVEGRAPVPVAHLTVRGRDGIWLRITPREGADAPGG